MLNSVDLSPEANYTDRATATCRRNLVPTFVDPSRPLISVFWTGGVNFSFKYLLIYSHKG
jgi:hypothetical protein